MRLYDYEVHHLNSLPSFDRSFVPLADLSFVCSCMKVERLKGPTVRHACVPNFRTQCIYRFGKGLFACIFTSIEHSISVEPPCGVYSFLVITFKRIFLLSFMACSTCDLRLLMCSLIHAFGYLYLLQWLSRKINPVSLISQARVKDSILEQVIWKAARILCMDVIEPFRKL